MILKESKLRQTFLKYSKNFLNTKQNEMTIGLEMELQQDSSLTDEIFSLESKQELGVVVMVEETERTLQTEGETDIYFYVGKVEGESNTRKLIDDFIYYTDRFAPQLEKNELQDCFAIKFLHLDDNIEPLEMFNKFDIRFKEYTGYGNNISGWQDIKRRFYGSADWWKDKYLLDDLVEMTEDFWEETIDISIKDLIFEEEYAYDYEEIIEKTKITEYRISLFIEKPSGINDLGDRKKSIIEYFSNNPKLYERYISKYGLEMVNEYQPNSKHSYFSVEYDGSLVPNDGYINAFEFKTPFGMTLNEQLDFFEQFLINEENQNYQLMPNDSCGLHVNISIDDQEFNVNYLDYVMLFILFNEKKLKLNTRGGDVDTLFHFQNDIQEKILNNVKMYLTKNHRTFVEKYNNFKLLKTRDIYEQKNKELFQDLFKERKIESTQKIQDLLDNVSNDRLDDEELKNNGLNDQQIESAKKDIENKLSNINKKRSIFILKDILEVFNEQVKQIMQGEKYLSMTKKQDRIEFRIMGGDYLKHQVKSYILEVQSVFQQQHYQPEELRKECYRKQISMILKYEPVNISISNIMGNKVEMDLKSLIDLEMFDFQQYYTTIRKYINFINSIEKDQDKVDNLTDQERTQEVINEWQKMFKEDMLEFFKGSKLYDNKRFKLFLTILHNDITLEEFKRSKYRQILHDWMDRLMVLYQLNHDFNEFKKGINKKYRELISKKELKDNDVEKIMDI